MPGSLQDRLAGLAGALRGAPQLRHVRLGDAVWAAVSWYGLNRRRIERGTVVTPVTNDLLWVDVGPFALAWPAASPLSRLAAALVELWAPSNPHYYFSPNTPVRRGDLVLDIGSCEGSFALECLERRGAERVWCFEPDARMARALAVTAERNGLTDRMTVVRAAVTDRTGETEFIELDDDPLSSHALDTARDAARAVRVRVPTVSLDDWVRENDVERVDYVKIDAEGSDLDILRGAETMLRRWRPALAVTTYHDPRHCNAMTDYLRSLDLGYDPVAKGVMTFEGVPRPVMLHATSATRPAR